MDHASPPVRPRPRPRIPSGPRARPDSGPSRHSSSSMTMPDQGSMNRPVLRSPTSMSALDLGETSRTVQESPTEFGDDGKVGGEGLTTSPRQNDADDYASATLLRPQQSMPILDTQTLKRERGRTVDISTPTVSTPPRESTRNRSQKTPSRAASPASFLMSLAPVSTAKTRPTPARLNTSNLLSGASSSPDKPTSPRLRHWQQVRQHVMATPAVEEKDASKPGRKFALVSKAAGKVGLRRQASAVPAQTAPPDRMSRGMSFSNGDLSAEEQEIIARQRRRFAHDVRVCLDACAAEESKRRLQRASQKGDAGSTRAERSGVTMPRTTMHGSAYASPRYAFDPEYSCFAPLLMELHRHLPDARAKRAWSRTCPHHGEILADLGFTFLQDDMSTDGERHQALEIFGVIVRNWAPENADEELHRWTWLVRALKTPDRQLRSRGLSLLSQFLRNDPELPQGPKRPSSATALLTLADDLLALLNAVENAGYGGEEHLGQIKVFLVQLAAGAIIKISPETILALLGPNIGDELDTRSGGVEKEVIWMALVRSMGHNRTIADWCLSHRGAALKVGGALDESHEVVLTYAQRFLPPPILHATPPVILYLRAQASVILLSSLVKLLRQDNSLPGVDTWSIAQQFILPELDILPDPSGTLAKHLGTFLLRLELCEQQMRLDRMGSTDPNDPFSSGDDFLTPSTDHRDWLAKNLSAQHWKAGLEIAAKTLVSLTRWFWPPQHAECVFS